MTIIAAPASPRNIPGVFANLALTSTVNGAEFVKIEQRKPRPETQVMIHVTDAGEPIREVLSSFELRTEFDLINLSLLAERLRATRIVEKLYRDLHCLASSEAVQVILKLPNPL